MRRLVSSVTNFRLEKALHEYLPLFAEVEQFEVEIFSSGINIASHVKHKVPLPPGI